MIDAAPAATRRVVGTRLLAGPPPSAGQERFAEHERRVGPRPAGGAPVLAVLEASGLQGRGGAWFPTWRKWRAVRDASEGNAVVVVNGSEGEPLSAKDTVLLQLRPHLVLDGAQIAAESVGADRVVVYLSRSSKATELAVAQAIEERSRAAGPTIAIERTAHRYVAGESSAVINRVSGGSSKPVFRLGHSSQSVVSARPTLVQNVETLAHAALIARRGSDWFRALGTSSRPGTTLMTLAGNVANAGVHELDLAATVEGVLRATGGTLTPPAGALIGGYFGTWLSVESLEGAMLADLPLGCGVLAVLPQNGCAIVEATRITEYLASESAEQCGPCVNGLAALAETMVRIAESKAESGDAEQVRRWMDMVKGRGACHHPDGAVQQLNSAITVFESHLRAHLMGRQCPGLAATGFPVPPRHVGGWR